MHKYRKWKAAWRKIGVKAKYYRSSWEANFARYLQFLKQKKIIRNWWYEPQTFYFNKIKRGIRSYLPDFKVKKLNCTHYWVEVKGWMDAKSKTKIKRFRKYYPKEQLFIVDKKWFDKNSKNLSKVCDDWEHPAPRKIKPKNNVNNKRKNNMTLECMHVKVHQSGSLFGFADLFSNKWGVEIRGCPIFEKEGRKWINLPSKEYEEDGEKKYYSFLRFREKSHLAEFVRQAVKSIEDWLTKNSEIIDNEDKTEESLPF